MLAPNIEIHVLVKFLENIYSINVYKIVMCLKFLQQNKMLKIYHRASWIVSLIEKK